jgi:hypothetical protein
MAWKSSNQVIIGVILHFNCSTIHRVHLLLKDQRVERKFFINPIQIFRTRTNLDQGIAAHANHFSELLHEPRSIVADTLQPSIFLLLTQSLKQVAYLSSSISGIATRLSHQRQSVPLLPCQVAINGVAYNLETDVSLASSQLTSSVFRVAPICGVGGAISLQ